ncbi:MAG: tail tape measure protein [Alphaproteobacteria bacterium]|nr:tail tape measure protein [Alphaproteobacteria bacterium]MBV9371124.1 tail tape measure protein [Alphaproteobacteria bacterium]MBV9900776.1 tail tape measure protein [Alphaproteobacteria bacterium]
MDEEIERLLVSVRADTGAFARDVADMRGQLEGPLAQGVERAGRVIEGALLRAVRSGKLGFDDLKQVALSAMAEIAAAAYRAGIAELLGGGGGKGGGGAAGGALGALAQVLAGALGASGRATGGPVTAGRAYRVGERGPELFVPTAAGRIEPGGAGGREIRVSIAVNAPAAAAPQALARSTRQIAREVRRALEQLED